MQFNCYYLHSPAVSSRQVQSSLLHRPSRHVPLQLTSLPSDEADSFLTFAPDFDSYPSSGRIIDGMLLHAPGGKVPRGPGQEDGNGFVLWEQCINIRLTTLHLIAPANLNSLTFYDRRHARMDRDTYWARPWPSGLALASFLSLNPELVRSKRVIELGAGLGAPGIMASLGGASQVLTTDRDQLALSCASMSAERSGASNITTALLDFTAPISPSLCRQFDLVLATDVLHERNLCDPLASGVKSLLKPGGMLLLTERTHRYPANLKRFVSLLGSTMSLDVIKSEMIRLPAFENEMLDFELADGEEVDTTFLQFRAL
jgi:predicted nicotinamide N-methyase